MIVKNNSKFVVNFKVDGKNYSLAPRNTQKFDKKYQRELEKIISRKSELQLMIEAEDRNDINLTLSDNILKRLYSLIHELKTKEINLLKRRNLNWVEKCGEYQTVGGSTTEAINLKNITSKMITSVTLTERGVSQATILTAKCVEGGLEVTFDVDPGNDHKINYIIVNC